MTFLEILSCAVLIAISAFMSAAEVALFSLSRFQLRSLKERFRGSYRRIKKLLGDPSGLLVTILVINEIVNVAISTILAGAVSRTWETGTGFHLAHYLRDWLFPRLPDWVAQIALGIVVTSPVLLLLCEATPKVIAARANQLIAPLAARPLSAVYELARPARFLLQGFVARLSRLIGQGRDGEAEGEGAEKPLLREEDFLSMVEEGHREGAIHQNELDLIRNVFEMDDTPASDISTPISQVYSLPSGMPLRNALLAISGKRFSRIPVTDPSRRRIVGVLYSKDLLLTRLESQLPELTVGDLARKPLIVHPSMRLNAVFRRMKQNQTHLAVVEATAGVPAGIVTMADVLAALFDDILPDEDSEEAAR